MSSENIIGRVPPSAIDIEKAVLGSAMLEPEGCKTACELLNENAFYDGRHSIIFSAIKKLHDAKTPVDILTVTQELIRTKQLASVGGAYEVTNLTNSVASSSNVETHCRILLQMYFKRELIRLSVELNKNGYDVFTDPFDLIDNLKKSIKNMESQIFTNSIIDNNKVIDDVLISVEEAGKNGGIIGKSTGLKNLDYAIMGLRKKFKYLIAAQAAIGKTALAKTIAVDLANVQGSPGVFFTLEVTADMFMIGCLSQILEIPNHLIQTGQLTALEKHQIKCLKDTLFTKSLIIDDRGGLSPEEIRATVRRLKESHNIEWFMVDYINLQRLKGNDNKNKSKEEKIAEIVNENKNIAKEYDLICIELAQLTKEISKREGGKPNIGDLKDSSAIEQSADVVILIHRPEKHGIQEYNGISSQGIGELIIAKNKWGPLKNIITKYRGEYTAFYDYEQGREFVPNPF